MSSTVQPALASLLTPGGRDRLMRMWYVRLPRMLDPWSTRLADAFADSTWAARWPLFSAYHPAIAFALGFLFPLVYPGMQYVYTESLLFLILLIAGSILSGAFGAMLAAGYIAGDLLTLLSVSYHLVRYAMGDIVSYMLLALPAVVMPQLGRRMAEEMATPAAKDASVGRVILRVALYSITMGLLTALWCQAMIVLVRPVFVFAGQSPITEAVTHIQNRWAWLAGIASVAALARLIVEDLARRGAAGAPVRGLEEERWSAPERRGAIWRQVPLAVRVLLAAVVATLMLSGTYVGMFDAIIVLAAIVAVKGWRWGLFGSMPAAWVRNVTRVPALIRFMLAPLIGYPLARMIMAAFWSTGSLRPLMLGTLLTFIIAQALFPPPPPKKESRT